MRAVELARKYASVGAIPFTKEAIYQKAASFMHLTDDEFCIKESTISEMPIVNEAALKQAHIPDTETGIVGNSKEGVRDPKASVKTEDINPNVRSDAKISKQSSIVPQLQVNPEGGNLDLSSMFTTTLNKLARKGVDISVLRAPKYR